MVSNSPFHSEINSQSRGLIQGPCNFQNQGTFNLNVRDVCTGFNICRDSDLEFSTSTSLCIVIMTDNEPSVRAWSVGCRSRFDID